MAVIEAKTHLDLDPQEDGEFMLVRGLEPKEKKGKGKLAYAVALERTSPESGSFIRSPSAGAGARSAGYRGGRTPSSRSQEAA